MWPKIILLLVISLAGVQSSYSSDRVVLMEQFTSTTCPPCVPANQYFDNWIKSYANKDRVAIIKYHMYWPSPGNDPYYHANPTENLARKNYYSVSSVPHARIDGTINGGSSYSNWPSLIINQMSVPSQFTIDINGDLNSTTGGTLSIVVTSDNNPIPTGTLVLQTLVVENELNYTGTNGDPVHHQVMRKMYPDANGEVFTINPNETKTFNRNITWNSGWAIKNSQVVVFIQVVETKSALQAAMRRAQISLAAPILSYPQNNATNLPLNATLSWRRVLTQANRSIKQDVPASAVTYHLQVAKDIDFNTIVFSDSTLTDTVKMMSKLERSTWFYWRVKAKETWGTSDWSNTWKFKTIPLAPSLILLTEPADNATLNTSSVTFSWLEGEPEVTKYQFEIDTSPTMATAIVDSSIVDTFSVKTGFVDNQEYWWRVRAANAAGWGEYSLIRKIKVVLTDIVICESVPTQFKLYYNYPNPFNPTTNIKFDIPNTQSISLKVFDWLGREVKTLFEGIINPGHHTIPFIADGLNSGIYLVELSTSNYRSALKMIYQK